MSLRLIPNVDVTRPSNSIEMNHSYRYAFSDSKNPKVLSLTQDLDYLDLMLNMNFQRRICGFLRRRFYHRSFRIELEIAFKIKAALEYSQRIVSVPILNKLSNMKNEEINELLKNKHVFH